MFTFSSYGSIKGNGYTAVETPRLIDATHVALLFSKPPSWFKRDRVRKALYARGFPAPVIRGRWSRSAIDSWLSKEGARAKKHSS
jgi:hypothetical protein